MEHANELMVQRLGECTIPSPMSGVRFTGDGEHILLHSDLGEIRRYLDSGSAGAGI